MYWNDVLAVSPSVQGRTSGNPDVTGVQYDSRRVTPGDAFIATRGETSDGNHYTAPAIAAGASVIVTDSEEMATTLFQERCGVPIAVTGHGRRALAEMSSAVFGRPQDKLKISAVTGTNGKTTTAFLLEQMLASVGRKCVLVGTIETRIAGEGRPSEHTTPESRDLLALFAEGVAAGCTEVVMEMSSHALAQERVWGLPVDVAIFTNLTQDHLDYHATMERYAAAKAKLFAGVGTEPPRVGVVHAAGEYSEFMRSAFAGKELMVFGVGAAAPSELLRSEGRGTRGEVAGAYYAEEVQTRVGATSFRFVTPVGSIAVESKLSGRVNVENLMAGMCAALARGLTLQDVAEAAKDLKQIPGRFEVVTGSGAAGFTVVVDYAHTDDALKNLIELGRDLVGEHGGRVITMFGCGGDRDRTKRPKMGHVAASESDFVVVTSDNPRSEEPMSIINEIVQGMHEALGKLAGNFVVEQDRGAAIEVAIRAARPGDIVLLAGKGHEKVQVFAEGAVPFDDVAVAAEVLRSLAG